MSPTPGKLVGYSTILAFSLAALAFIEPKVVRESSGANAQGTSSAAVAKYRDASEHSVGAQPALRLAINPSRSLASVNGEHRLEVTVEAVPTRGATASVALAYHLVDELGGLVGDVERVPPRSTEKDERLGESASVSGTLPDGVYELRAVAVAVGDFEEDGVDSQSETQTSAYFRVAAGEVTPIEFSEWYRARNDARLIDQKKSFAPVSIEPITPELRARYEEYLRKQARKEREAP